MIKALEAIGAAASAACGLFLLKVVWWSFLERSGRVVSFPLESPEGTATPPYDPASWRHTVTTALWAIASLALAVWLGAKVVAR